MPRLSDVERIAVLHARGLGDLVFALPALAALQAAYPAAEITLLGNRWYPSLLVGRRSPVDRVVPVPPAPGIRDGAPDDRELDRFFAAQRTCAYDLAVQLHGGGRNSNPFLLRLGARHTAGSRTPDAPPLERTLPYFHYQHEVLRGLEIVGLVGAPPGELEPVLPVVKADLTEAAAVVPSGSRPLAVLHPGASDPRRRWPAERFGAVASALSRAGASVVVTGTARERSLVAEVIDRAAGQAVDLCDRLSLPGLVGLLSRAAVVVSNDSGPAHLASAVGAAVVGLYWCGNVITAAPLTRGRHRVVISWQLICPVCRLDCTVHDCGHEESFLGPIPVHEVCDYALDLLDSPPRAPCDTGTTAGAPSGPGR